ncbi:hypothetical protein FACS1894153_0490 [Bacteroidia bacterium]|nr:hypothetical protein FACS1894153_0490 [Bacteroidia bacterium]
MFVEIHNDVRFYLVFFYFFCIFVKNLVMNPIVVYPKNAEQSKFFKDTAKSKGIEMVFLSKKFIKDLEELEESCFGKKLVERSETPKNISRKKMMALFNRKLSE